MPETALSCGAASAARPAAWPLRAATLLAMLAVVLAPPMHHAVAALLDFTQRWRGGERLYGDLTDVNPPLVFVLLSVPVRIAGWLPLGAAPAALLCVLALCGLGAWLSLALAGEAVPVSRDAGIPACGDRFGLLAYFLRHPLFAAAFRRYRLFGEVDGYLIYKREG